MDEIHSQQNRSYFRSIVFSGLISLTLVLAVIFFFGKPITNLWNYPDLPTTSYTLDIFMAQRMNKEKNEQKPILVFFSDNKNHSENMNWSWSTYVQRESLHHNPNADQVRWVQTFLESPIYDKAFHHNDYQNYIPKETNQSFKTQKDFYEYYIQLNFPDAKLPFALLLDSDLNILAQPISLKNGNYSSSKINKYIKEGIVKRYARLSEGEALYTKNCASCHTVSNGINTRDLGGITLYKNPHSLQDFVKSNIIKNTSPSQNKYKHQFTYLSNKNINDIFLHVEDIHFNKSPKKEIKKEFANESEKLSGDSLFNVNTSGPVDSLLNNGEYYQDGR